MIQTGDSTVGKERLSALYQQQLNQEYCDVVAKVGKEKFNVHSCILAAASPKLHNLIQKSSKKSSAQPSSLVKEIRLKVFTPTSFLRLIPYFYLGAIEYNGLSIDDLRSILKSAKWCNFNEVVTECTNLIKQETNAQSIKDAENQVSPSQTDEIMLKCEFCSEKFETSNTTLFTDHVASHNTINVEAQKDNQPPQVETSKRHSVESNSETSCHKKPKMETQTTPGNANLQTVVMQNSPALPDHGLNHSDVDVMSNDDDCSVDCISIVCEFDDDSIEPNAVPHRKPRKSLTQKMPHRKAILPAKTWTCVLCPNEMFYKKHDQVTHIKQIHGVIKRFSCDHCGKEFTAASLLNMHLRTHSEEKTDVCVECGKCFADKKNLKDHLRKHTGEKPFLCTLCGKSFTFRQSLYRHMKFHEGEKPHTCEICGKAFVLKHNLKEHLARHEKHNTVTCKQCHITSPTKEDALAHLKTCKMYLPITL